jgi:hypothetical protein
MLAIFSSASLSGKLILLHLQQKTSKLEVSMKNGDHLTGTVNIINDDLVKITPPYSSPLLIKQSAIKKIEQNSSISVKKTTSTNDLPRFETEQWKLSGKGDMDLWDGITANPFWLIVSNYSVKVPISNTCINPPLI